MAEITDFYTMRILHTVESYFPSTGGAQEVVLQLSEGLARRGHSVTVATSPDERRDFTSRNGVEIVEFPISGNSVVGMNGPINDYLHFIQQGNFDLMMNYAAQQWATDALLPHLRQMPLKKVLVPCGFSGLRRWRYRAYFKAMAKALGSYDKCIYLSATYQDALFARKVGLKNGTVIPNGASEPEFLPCPQRAEALRRELGIGPDEIMVLHVGSHTGLKGHREAIEIFLSAQIPNAKFLLVGNESPGGCMARCKASERRADGSVLVRSLSRAETVAAFHAADLFLFPSNVECSPIVLFEAMAAGLPFLSTDVGNSREIVEKGGGGILLPTRINWRGRSYARKRRCVPLLQSLALDGRWRAELGARGKAAWQKDFTWEKIVDRYESLYAELIRV